MTKRDGPMPGIAFRIMALIMTIRGLFRDKRGEVLLTGVKSGDVFLDFGCGLGFSTLPAAEIVGEQGVIYALDIHSLAIDTVRRKAEKKGLGNIKTILSGQETGISGESVDIAFLLNVLPMIKDRSGVVKEIYRVLKPSGSLWVKSGKGANLCAGGRLDQEYLEKLMTDNGPLKLKAVNGKYYHFEKD